MGKPSLPQFSPSDNQGELFYKLRTFVDELTRWADEVQAGLTGGGGSGTSSDSTFVTSDDESADLPNSRQLIAGQQISLDATVANKLTINASAYPPQLGHAGI